MPAIHTLDNSIILVTGASGFVGSHVIDQLLSRGARVRGAVRSHDKGRSLQELFKSAGENFQYVIVEDIGADGAFDEAVEDVVGVVHTASPLVHQERGGTIRKQVIDPAVQGTTGILKSAQKCGSKVKRIVMTSSICSAIDPILGKNSTYSEENWNNSAVTSLQEDGENVNIFHAHLASKVLAERAAWEWTQKNSPNFDIVCILPGCIIGPIINTSVSLLDYGNGGFYDFLLGKEVATPEAAQNTPGYPTVDVRDVALVHIESLVQPAAGGKRIAACEGAHFYEAFLEVARTDPQLSALFPNMVRKSARPNPDSWIPNVDASLSKQVLGLRYRPFEETVRESALSYLEYAKAKGW